MIKESKIIFNFSIISFIIFIIIYLLKINNKVNINKDKLVLIGLIAGFVYLLIIYFNNLFQE